MRSMRRGESERSLKKVKRSKVIARVSARSASTTDLQLGRQNSEALTGNSGKQAVLANIKKGPHSVNCKADISPIREHPW